MNWLIAVIALSGLALITNHKWQGFLFWLVSNAWWSWHNLMIDEYAQAGLYGVFWLWSLYGIYKWKRKDSNHGRQKNSIRHDH